MTEGLEVLGLGDKHRRARRGGLEGNRGVKKNSKQLQTHRGGWPCLPKRGKHT